MTTLMTFVSRSMSDSTPSAAVRLSGAMKSE